MIRQVKQSIKRALPVPWLTSYYLFRFQPDDPAWILSFLVRGSKDAKMSFVERLDLVGRFYATSFSVDCPHTQSQILAVVESVFSVPGGCVVEAGCFKGGSTAKLSLGVRMKNKKLFVFDSFQGIPQNSEPHARDIFGTYLGPFQPGSYLGPLDEVRRNIRRFGAIDVCEFMEGWFEQTLPRFSASIGVVYLDVDLVSSTRICLKYLYPQLIPGGVLISQDGHLPLVVQLFNDDAFWENEVGCQKPPIERLGIPGLIKVTKPNGLSSD